MAANSGTKGQSHKAHRSSQSGGSVNKKKQNPKAKRLQSRAVEKEQRRLGVPTMDDDIDAFHNQRDLIPFDASEAANDSEDDEEVPVFDFEDDEDENSDEDDLRDSGLDAKILKQQQFMKQKFGGLEDQMDDDEEAEEEEPKARWGGKKDMYYNADNTDFELQSSDDQSAEEEEAEVIRLQKETAKSMSVEDFGIQDTSEDETDREFTLEEIPVKGKSTRKIEVDFAIEEVKKDFNSLSREELMDVLNRSAPELVGLLSELDDAIQELETKIDPLLEKVENGEIKLEGGIRYLELKKQILLSYCQAIVFYLLLKSEGQPVRDHPVLDRLVEIKSLFDKTKELDRHCPTKPEEILKNNTNLRKEHVVSAPDSQIREEERLHVSSEVQTAVVPINNAELGKVEVLKENGKKAEKRKRQEDKVGVESMKMLKVRAALEEKLKQKGVFGSVTPKANDNVQKLGKPLNRQLETYNDFDDDTTNANGHKSCLSSSKLSKLIAARPNKPKIVSGDGDLPMRDNIGERRRKYELRVLARAGVEVDDEAEVNMENEESGSEDDLYKQVKQQRAAKLAARAETYSRTAPVPSLPETTDGKRLITYQMEKNRGLTRQRKKLTKNPRKKYKLKHQKAVKNRGGQVRQVKKPMGPYGGESTGINAGISRSVRFKN